MCGRCGRCCRRRCCCRRCRNNNGGFLPFGGNDYENSFNTIRDNEVDFDLNANANLNRNQANAENRNYDANFDANVDRTNNNNIITLNVNSGIQGIAFLDDIIVITLPIGLQAPVTAAIEREITFVDKKVEMGEKAVKVTYTLV